MLSEQAKVWLPSVVELRPIVAHLGEGGYHLAFQTNGGESQYFLDTIFMPPLTQNVPEAAILTAPPTDDTEVEIYPALYRTPTDYGVLATSFDDYFDDYLEETTIPVDPEANPTTLLGNVASSPYFFAEALDYGKTYIWKIVAKMPTAMLRIVR